MSHFRRGPRGGVDADGTFGTMAEPLASGPARPSNRRRSHVVLALSAVLLGAGWLPAQSGALEDQAPSAEPLLIKHGWDVPSPEFVRSNINELEQLPFDGLTIKTALSHMVQGQTPISYEAFRDALEPVSQTTFQSLRNNFVMVYSAPAGDLFSDWTVPVENFRNLARASADAGLVGVFYDNEEYFGDALQYPSNCANHTVEECRTQAQLRGRQVMEAMVDVWPDARVLVARGPWISAPEIAEHLTGLSYNDVAWANPLEGPFAVGMVLGAAGSQARIIDGGEIYTARTQEQFATIRTLQQQLLPEESELVPDSLKPLWSSTVSASFGVYDLPAGGVPMDAATWRTTLTNALTTTDEYVWAYTEGYDWTGTGWPATRVPAEWVEATWAARADAN